MDENLTHLLQARLHAAVLSFAKAHKLHLTSEIIKFDAWTTQKTFDITVRVDLKSEEGEVV